MERGFFMNRLTGEAISIGYGDKLIVNELNLEVPDGKVTSIIGPNGCGKSTLLKALSRILNVQTGQVLLDGKNLHSICNIRRLGQNSNLFSYFFS